MSTVGPELPPHLLAKRKRQAELEESAAHPDEPARPDTPPEKKKRVVGPAPPPAPLDEQPPQPAHDSDSDSDDEWGPAPPSAGAQTEAQTSAFDDLATQTNSTASTSASKTQRDEWMIVPPTHDDLAARTDPTKIRARNKFSSGKGPVGGGEIASIWTETPEQKRKRLQNEIMGVSKPEPEQQASARKSQKDEEMARRVQEHNEKHRGKSLVEQHHKREDKEEEDDPTKRVFDYEKDMGSGAKIGHAQKAEMLKKAQGFGSRFSGGSYL